MPHTFGLLSVCRQCGAVLLPSSRDKHKKWHKDNRKAKKGS